MFFSANGDIINKPSPKEGFINLGWFHSHDSKDEIEDEIEEDLNDLKNNVNALTKEVNSFKSSVSSLNDGIKNMVNVNNKIQDKVDDLDEVQDEMNQKFSYLDEIQDEMEQQMLDINHFEENVGIGTLPDNDYKLNVKGDVNVDGDIRIPQAYSATYPDKPQAGKSSKLLFHSNPGFGAAGINYIGGILGNEQNGSYLNLFTNGSSKMAIKQNGNVGIGTTAPTGKLHVLGETQLQGSENTSHFNWAGSSTEDTYIRPGKDKGKVIMDKGKVGIGLAANAANAKFNVKGDVEFRGSKHISHFNHNSADRDTEDTYIRPGKDEGKVIMDVGKVGIGLTAKEAKAKFNVKGDVEFRGTKNISHFNWTGSSTEDTYIRPGKDGGKVIMDKGNVGIGTTKPTKKLDVNGSLKANQLCVGDNCLTSDEISKIKNSRAFYNGDYYYYKSGGCTGSGDFFNRYTNCLGDQKCLAIGLQENGCWHHLSNKENAAEKNPKDLNDYKPSGGRGGRGFYKMDMVY